MLSHRPKPARRACRCAARRQRGLSLIESLIALLVLALGIMGLAGVQTRLLVEGRIAGHRAVAIGLIDDLTNRILLNRDAATAGSYNLAWGATRAAVNCTTTQCTGAQLAQSDLNLWLQNVTSALPGGNATVFISPTDTRQIGIALAWRSNEKFSDSAYLAPFAVTALQNGVTCPTDFLCHLVYVQP